MPDLRIESRYEQPMAAVFTALVNELGRERWLPAPAVGDVRGIPQPGLRFGYRQAQRLYAGQVLECLRPVSIVLLEHYRGPAGSIEFRQRWRVEPAAADTLLRADLRIATNRFARLQLRFWTAHFCSRATRTCSRIRALLLAAEDQRGTTGHSNGSTSIVSANTTSVNGKPIFR